MKAILRGAADREKIHWMARRSLIQRMVGAAALRPAVYEEVEADPRATGQAVFVVLLSSVSAGIGARGFGGAELSDAVWYGAIALVAWAAWALLTYQIGSRFLPEHKTRADWGELLRTIGFASSPGVVRIAGIVPELTRPVFVIVAVWMLFAMVLAVRQALDYSSTGRAVAVCAIGWTLALVLAFGMGLMFGPDVS